MLQGDVMVNGWLVLCEVEAASHCGETEAAHRIVSVVPAKAGTHSPTEWLWRETGNPESSPNFSLWLWVPAFAGTTFGRDRALPQHDHC
ncbi:hypothetical protein AYJ54_30825 [Bradyrhizobium centrolobii]|uniref:Uncharacterized protein n=1 Tax=Bradyrhizobium centrolobii TaxID=1505087 RepID=A0A176Y9D1_9BRAD|nr:hypothetical protein AYJ54_30825 [Bradyrhizobium centrolobii]